MNTDASRSADEANAAQAASDSRDPASANDRQTEGNLESDLEQVRSQAQTYLDLAQRTQADFVNYKRRIEQEKRDWGRSANADIVLKILPTLDDLTRAIKSLPPDLAGSDWAQGIVLIERKFQSELESLGLKRIELVGKPFDPWEAEALMHEPSSEHPAGTVTSEIRAGYTLDGKVIRPAQVIVSSGSPQDATTS